MSTSFPVQAPPLTFTVIAFTSPQRSYVTADPGYESGMFSAKVIGARVVKVPLTKTYAHDVKAMIAAAPDAGLFYICNPNNPTGTLTPHSDIEYLVENKPKGSIVMVDEAYIHFCDAPSTLDLVKAGKDVVVLRTFSKAYGMAGLRCGFAIARPDLLDKIHEPRRLELHARHRGGRSLGQSQRSRAWSRNASASTPASARKLSSGSTATATPTCPPSRTAFCSTPNAPAKQVIDAMAQQNVFIGRVWPIMPTCVRITVGTHDEMEQFQAALQKVMREPLHSRCGQRDLSRNSRQASGSAIVRNSR